MFDIQKDGSRPIDLFSLVEEKMGTVERLDKTDKIDVTLGPIGAKRAVARFTPMIDEMDQWIWRCTKNPKKKTNLPRLFSIYVEYIDWRKGDSHKRYIAPLFHFLRVGTHFVLNI